MSARRSGRAKAPVKYTSDSEGSDFGAKKARTKATPKKRAKPDDHTAEPASTPRKRTKKDASNLAAEHLSKAQAQESKAAKAAHKKSWEAWLAAHDVAGKLLDDEPAREDSVTQTDAQKKYGLKKEELGSLRHFEKRNPVYNNTIKLFLEDEVRALAYRKYGMLDGVEGGEKDVLRRGEEIWKEEHKNELQEDTPDEQKKTDKPPKEKTPKQKWTAYVESHTVASPESLPAEPEDAINQSDCKAKYALLPGDLAVLPYFPKPNQKYGNTTKLFKEGEVKTLAYRKAAVVGGIEDGDEEALLKRGKELFEAGKK